MVGSRTEPSARCFAILASQLALMIPSLPPEGWDYRQATVPTQILRVFLLVTKHISCQTTSLPL